MQSRTVQSVLRPLSAAAALSALALLLAASPARAQYTQDQRAACEGDALRVCGEFVPDIERIKACMYRKRAQLSPACRVYFRGGKPKTKAR